MRYLKLEEVKSDFQKASPWSWAAALYIFSTINDYISSIWAAHTNILGLHEANPFARDASLHFVLWKGIVIDFLFGLVVFLMAFSVYRLVRLYHEPLAKVLSAGIPVFMALSRLYDPVVPNYLYDLHMYVKSPNPPIEEFLFRIFGM